MENTEVKALTGIYQGFKDKNEVEHYLGIPYVKPPQRWKKAEKLEHSEQIIRAQEYGPACWQNWVPEEFEEEPPMSEDCLTLNIWVKDRKKAKKSVMIWIHGGSYYTGSNRMDCCHGMYCGDRFVAENPDIIYVNINYRINAFGSMDLSLVDTDGEYTDSSNLQTLDQMAAIHWVYENIASFGGNPDNITIFGQSAGSYSVSTLLLIPETGKYVKQAICESSGIDETLKTRAQGQDIFRQFQKVTNVKTLKDCLMLSPQDILKGAAKIMENPIFPAFCGMKEGGFIPEHPFEVLKQGVSSSIRVMNGTTAGEYDSISNLVDDEQTIENIKFAYTNQVTDEMIEKYIAHDPKRDRSTALKDLFNDSMRITHIKMSDCLVEGGSTVYMYYIPYMGEEDRIRPQHCYEIPFITDRLEEQIYMDNRIKEPVQGRSANEIQKRRIQGCWASFARTGNPNGAHLDVEWEEYAPETRNTMVIDKAWHMENGVRNEDVDLFMEAATTVPDELTIVHRAQ